MKPTRLGTILIALILLTLPFVAETGWGKPSRLQAIQGCADQAGAVVTFVDPNLAAAVRTALSADADEKLTCLRVSSLTGLTAEEADIEDLRGIEALTGLTELHLDGNPISDLSPLSRLASLTALYLWGGSVRDLTPLAGLKELTILHIGNNSINDIRSLKDHSRLRDLSITHNAVSDLGPLSGLTELEVLRVYNNPISDITALRELTKLTELHIHDLPELSNIQPLLENVGLGKGDRVILMRSGVSCRAAGALQAKGVSVTSGCLGGIPIKWWGFVAITAGIATLLAVVRRRRKQRVAP